MIRFIAAALLCLAATEAPAAVSLYDRYFAERESVAPCYARQPDTPRPGRRIARCEAADDAGEFTLAPERAGVKLTIGNRLMLEGPETFSPDLSDGRDDLI